MERTQRQEYILWIFFTQSVQSALKVHSIPIVDTLKDDPARCLLGAYIDSHCDFLLLSIIEDGLIWLTCRYQFPHKFIIVAKLFRTLLYFVT